MINLLLMAAMAAPVQDEAKCITVSDVLEWMTHEAKRKFVVDEMVTANFASKRITVAADLMDKTKAYDVGLALLRSAGLAAVPLEESAGGAIRIVPSGQARFEQLRVYGSVEALPRADEYCILALTLKVANVRQVHQALSTSVNPQGIAVMEGSRAILISDYASNLRKVAAMVRLMDASRGASAYTLSVAVLEGETAKEASVPEAFRKVDLKAVTDKTSFVLRQQAGVRADFLGDQNRTTASLRLDGRPSMIVSINGSNERGGGITLDRLSVVPEVENRPSNAVLLDTRLDLVDGEWAIAGTLPGTKEGTVQVILVRAIPVK